MTRFRFGIATILQGAEYPQLREAWQAIDGMNLDLITFWDHYLPISGDIDAPNHEVWTLLGALAECTERVRFVPSVISTARHDARLIANAAATVDHISNGRLELGLGAGGVPDEHRRYGLPFPSAGERVARLEESIRVILLLWSERRAHFAGRFFRLDDAPCEPKPVQRPHPPLTIAGGGEKRSLRIVARYAATWRAFNTAGNIPALAAKNRLLDDYCREIGRDPATLERAEAVTPPADWWTGAPDEGVAALRAYAEAGVNCFILAARPPFPLQQIERFAREVVPRFRTSVGT
ncbi:MAG: monooxygenase [Dehalococcoidia bacterium]|nr:MAG: monooxygenase [Dehalococcoidia bacterium]